MKDPQKMPDGTPIVHFNVGVLPSDLEGHDPLPGSRLRPCFACGRDVWLGPQSLLHLDRTTVCEPCALKLSSATPEQQRIWTVDEEI